MLNKWRTIFNHKAKNLPALSQASSVYAIGQGSGLKAELL
jgi:hypothetical protein